MKFIDCDIKYKLIFKFSDFYTAGEKTYSRTIKCERNTFMVEIVGCWMNLATTGDDSKYTTEIIYCKRTFGEKKNSSGNKWSGYIMRVRGKKKRVKKLNTEVYNIQNHSFYINYANSVLSGCHAHTIKQNNIQRRRECCVWEWKKN